MRNQDNPQGRHFGFSSETNRDSFLDIQSGPARTRQKASTCRLSKRQTGFAFEGHGVFLTPRDSTKH